MSQSTELRLAALAVIGLLALPGCRAEPAQAKPVESASASSNGRVKVAATDIRPAAQQGGGAMLSMLDVREPMTFGAFVWDERGAPEGPVWIRIDLTRQIISVFRGDYEIGTAVILYGGGGKPTPIGEFPVLEKARDYQSKTYDAPMPYMVRLTRDGVAIHASNVRPGWATHGCIGVPMEFAHHLYDAVKLGDRVSIS